MKELRHWPTLAANTWPIFGEKHWPSLGENTWPSIARKMTVFEGLRIFGEKKGGRAIGKPNRAP